jgi:hypothetical protein
LLVKQLLQTFGLLCLTMAAIVSLAVTMPKTPVGSELDQTI